MVESIVEISDEMSSVISRNTFSFPVSDRDERNSLKGFMYKFMDFFGIIALVHEIEVRFSGSVTLFQERFRMAGIVNRMLGNLEAGHDLFCRIDGYRSFQESLSGFPGSPGIIMAGVRTGESGGIDCGAGNLLSPVVEHLHDPVE